MRCKLLLVLLAVPLAQAQSFEVAAIRPHTGPLSMIGVNLQGSNFTATGFSVRNLITFGFDLETYQVAGVESANSWTTTDYYNIAARVPGDVAPVIGEARKMVQVLLAERFQLKLRRETQEQAVYALVTSKNGIKLKENAAVGPSMSMNATQMTFTGAPLQMLVRQLSGIGGLDRPVVDQTGLKGRYDFVFKTAFDRASGATTGPSGESIFTAVEEQLGLKLEARKEPIEILVIDHVERPSEN
jgi:uncharacterized protein (TIGR03435 family)